ncbi:MAG: hypothetical protein OMM_05203 [Candidatus Magnetoglobus multicellularis str. Araruama]|uniref:CARDB domain-containing protein n=1 Tax=Candidatus Magnetoglobus multicellularis str. Araruama TaxID=890399 RepID=A0A1V1NXI6_9BACT|nr:MAG: hypothetical protein OMM_05203 [Candidatus Magnetoglobus multicellularis str. Araruama]
MCVSYIKHYEFLFECIYNLNNRLKKHIFQISNETNEIPDEPFLSMVTLCILPIATKYFSDAQTLNAVAIELHNKILSFQDFNSISDNARMLNTALSSIDLTILFSDITSIIPNNCIDAGELSKLYIKLTNIGKGTAFDVTISINNNDKQITFTKNVQIDDVLPGETKK